MLDYLILNDFNLQMISGMREMRWEREDRRHLLSNQNNINLLVLIENNL